MLTGCTRSPVYSSISVLPGIAATIVGSFLIIAIGKRVRKKFGKKFYAGVVKQYKKPYLVVEDEDGDTEDQTQAEVKRILV